MEIVTIVRELTLQVARGGVPGVPSAHVIRLAPSGAVFIEGPVAAGGRSVARAAQLLDTLLPGFDAPPEFRAPGALRLVIARAIGTVDLPPFPSLEALADALSRFAASEPESVVRQLVASWAESVAAEQPQNAADGEPATPEGDSVRTERVLESFAASAMAHTADDGLTVSDLRRARRATGLTLTQVGDRSRIPVRLLRELEWGYLHEWPAGHYGRTQLVRYARAAGLDEEVVVRTVWPLLEEQSRAGEVSLSSVTALASDEDPADAGLATIDHGPQFTPVAPPSRRARLLAALAIPALLALAVAPGVWHLATRPDPAAPTAASRTEDGRAAAPESAPARPSAPADSVQQSEGTASPRSVAGAARVPDQLVPPASTLPDAPRRAQAVPASDAEPAAGLATDAVTYSPTFSAVGSAMFYHAEADGKSALMRADTDSRGAVLRITQIVDDDARNFHIRPSPDGRRIAFDSDREGERAVYVADANGQRVRRVTGEGFAAVPSWSPDGKSLAFVRAEPGRPDVWNLWTTDLATSTSRRLTNHRVGQPWGGSWFPDGKRLAYSHEDRLIVLDLESGAERIYPTPRKGRLVRTPAVSPDGRRVIFQVRRDGVWLLEMKDGTMRRVLADPSAEEFTWAPDGSRVAYHSSRTGNWGVWVMAPR
jgi:cytoskeletal protein RodZ